MGEPAESPNVPVKPGDVLAGKYRVERVLGAGGMGVVVAALHLELDERVAVKFLLPEVIGSPEAAARFVREARAAVKIKSEHVARVIDVGRLENGAPYMVMEYLSGADLSAIVREGKIPVDDAVDYVIQACDAMAEAHAHGIVHRDLKPANLFVTHRSDGAPIVKVLDFGISKISVPDVSEASLTKTSAVMGSPYYMSPEQMRSSRDVDHRTDVWALGTILFELLSGQPPFVADTLPELVTRILTEPPSPLPALRPEVSVELERVVLRCLEKQRDQRYQNVGQLAAALLPFAPRRSRHTAERVFKVTGSGGEIPTSLPPRDSRALRETAPVIPAKTDTSWAETKDPPPKKRTAVAIVAGCVAVGAIVIAGAAFLRGRNATEAKAEAPAPSAAVPAAPPAVALAPAEVARASAPVAPPPSAVAPPPSGSTPAPSVVPAPPSEPAALRAPDRRPRTAPASAAKAMPEPAASAPPPAPAPKPRRNPLAIDLK